MRAVTLDLARSAAPIIWWQWLLLLAAGAISVMSLINYSADLKAIARFDQEIAVAENHRSPGPGKQTQVDAHTMRALNSANQLIRRLQTPWDALFREIELAQSKEIALLAVQPNAERRTVMLEGEAKNASAALDYIVALEAQPSLADVSLVSHEVRREDAEKPIRFSLTAEWLRP